jgi:hypothetical protein
VVLHISVIEKELFSGFKLYADAVSISEGEENQLVHVIPPNLGVSHLKPLFHTTI